MSVKYTVDLDQEGRSYPHYWELSVGSCHAATILREDVREQIRKAHKDIGFRYLRFHGLLDDDMSVVIAGFLPGQPAQLSFFNIDSIFDFLLDAGMKPFVELGFMPEAYASTPHTTFHYKGFSSMPKKDSDWENLITELIKHLEERYGAQEVRSWFFEVWNEPNLSFFFDGTQEDYFHLYEMTARSIKAVDEQLKVGGPATSNNAWIPEFRNFCEQNSVPYDFITTHHYPSDDPFSTAGFNGPGKKGGDFLNPSELADLSPEEIQKKIAAFFNRENKNPRDILSQLAKKVKKEAGAYPVYYTEWNVGRYDTSYAAAGVLATLAYNEGLVEGYSYWCISDIFEELGLHGLPYNNEFGLVNVYGIPKPVYRVFEALHEAGDRRLEVTAGECTEEEKNDFRTAEVLALSGDGTVMLFAYNHDIEERKIRDVCMELEVKGSFRKAEKAVINRENTNPFACWEQMGKPAYPTKAQLAQIDAASRLVWKDVTGEENSFVFTAEKESVTIFRLTR